MTTPSRTTDRLVARDSFIELTARSRALALLDPDSARELVGPFDHLRSPWLPLQGITPQEDDGCIVMKGRIARQQAVVLAIEGGFQGGSVGEVGAAKMTAALEMARIDCEAGRTTSAVLLPESGGVRLQEAHLGLAGIAELLASIVALRRLAPVICLIAGPVGCFGGMSLAAALSSYILMTREARLGMNGPEVIEQESGVTELDAADRPLIWSIYGGEQRRATGLADALVDDDTQQIAETVRQYIARGIPPVHRSTSPQPCRFGSGPIETAYPWDPSAFHARWTANRSREESQ
jgi:malonate decarboxylase beta subunit